MINYGKHSISKEDIVAVADVLQSDHLTGGEKVKEFEQKYAEYCGAKFAVALSSGTASLHAAMHVCIEPGDKVIVPAITFIATANAVKYCGGVPVFADVDPDTLMVTTETVMRVKDNTTKAVITVDFAGQVCEIENYGCGVISDSCHSLKHHGHISCHSFHPVKHMTTGEGGMFVTDIREEASLVESFRNHGKTIFGNGFGYNYRMTDFQAALGISQLERLDSFIKRRQEIAAIYDAEIGDLALKKVSEHTYHLYVLKVPNRDEFRIKLAEKEIGTQIHYRPLTLTEPYKRPGYCPTAEKVWKEIVSIPIFPSMTDSEIQQVIEAVKGAA